MDPVPPRCPACDAALPGGGRRPHGAGARLRCGHCGAVPDASRPGDATLAPAVAADTLAASADGAAPADDAAGEAEACAAVVTGPADAAAGTAPPAAAAATDRTAEAASAGTADEVRAGAGGGARVGTAGAGPAALPASPALAAPAAPAAAVAPAASIASSPPAAPDAPDDPHFAATEPPPLPLPLRPDVAQPHDAAATGDAGARAEADLFPFLAGPEPDPRWRHPALCPALAAVAMLLALVLAAQAVLHWRDALAAARPALRPALDALCLAAGCSVGPLRRLDGVVVEGSEWNPSPAGSAAQLVVVIGNTGKLPVALPWVELTLTEVNGAVLARRALAPADFGVGAATLAPGSETVLRAALAVDGRPPAGYTVELFHP